MITAAEIRNSMRIKTASLDDEIERNITTARLELSRVGVLETVDNDLTDKAIELFCKAQFNYQGKSEQFEKNFEKLRDSLSVSGDYR